MLVGTTMVLDPQFLAIQFQDDNLFALGFHVHLICFCIQLRLYLFDETTVAFRAQGLHSCYRSHEPVDQKPTWHFLMLLRYAAVAPASSMLQRDGGTGPGKVIQSSDRKMVVSKRSKEETYLRLLDPHTVLEVIRIMDHS